MNTIGNIISTRRRSMGLSQTELASMLTQAGSKTTQKSISKWETNVNEPSIKDFLNLCKILEITDIYGEYFGFNPANPMDKLNTTGREKALDYINLLIASGLYSKPQADIVSLRSQLKLYDIPVSAGPGNFLEDSCYEIIEVEERISAIADFGVRISGDSMEPMFTNGQNVYVHSQNHLENGEIGIFYYDGNVYIKRFNKTAVQCTLVSLNPQYAPIEITEQRSFHILGKVVS